MDISIHALLAESDPPRVIREPATSGFLSTLSLRRATSERPGTRQPCADFYPRSPCGERHLITVHQGVFIQISIHALLAESDAERFRDALEHLHFYPRSPCGERLWANFSGFYWWVISIHALLAESDNTYHRIFGGGE